MENKDRTLYIQRIMQAPIELVWQVFSNPEHLAQWWGPHGFTSTISKFEFYQGGEWLMTMHGPDGTNYPNRAQFKEVVENEKIVFEHFNPHFFTSLVFTAMGNKTQIDWTMLFDTAEMKAIVVDAHKADSGLIENLERLQSLLDALSPLS